MTITAAEKLGVDLDLVEGWKDTQSKLDPIQIGDDGQIKEWYEETTLNSIPSEGYGHRHMSHLLGLFPGDSISVETPELLDAALVSLNNRTDMYLLDGEWDKELILGLELVKVTKLMN